MDTVASFPDSTVSVTKTLSGGVTVGRMGSPPYSPELFFCPVSEDLGIYGYSDEYRLWMVDLKGEVVCIIEKEEKKIQTSRKEESEYLKARMDRMNKSGGVQWAMGDIRKMYKFAKYKPFFSDIRADDSGHIYLQKPKSVMKPEEDTSFDLFSKEGYYLYKVKIHKINPRVIKDGCVYTYRTDPDTGYYKMERYRITNWDQVKD